MILLPVQNNHTAHVKIKYCFSLPVVVYLYFLSAFIMCGFQVNTQYLESEFEKLNGEQLIELKVSRVHLHIVMNEAVTTFKFLL